MIILSSDSDVKSLVSKFVKVFPDLAQPDIAIGRCKFYSMELAKFLMNHGVNCTVYHLQHIVDKNAWPNAHKDWRSSAAEDWSHYIVRAGNLAIDITSRQLDPENPHPSIFSFHKLATMWKTVERDNFITKVTKELA